MMVSINSSCLKLLSWRSISSSLLMTVTTFALALQCAEAAHPSATQSHSAFPLILAQVWGIMGQVHVIESTWQSMITASNYDKYVLKRPTEIFLQVPAWFLIYKCGQTDPLNTSFNRHEKQNPPKAFGMPCPFIHAQKWHSCLYKHVPKFNILGSCSTPNKKPELNQSYVGESISQF